VGVSTSGQTGISRSNCRVFGTLPFKLDRHSVNRRASNCASIAPSQIDGFAHRDLDGFARSDLDGQRGALRLSDLERTAESEIARLAWGMTQRLCSALCVRVAAEQSHAVNVTADPALQHHLRCGSGVARLADLPGVWAGRSLSRECDRRNLTLTHYSGVGPATLSSETG